MPLKHRIIPGLVLGACVSGAALVHAGTPSHPTVVWTTLAQVKESFTKEGKTVEFPREVAALDRARVSIQGFRVPLEIKTHFLLASKPTDCPHCIEGGAESYVEVFSKQPMKPTFGRPLTVVGKLELLKSDPGGIYYRMVDAELVSID